MFEQWFGRDRIGRLSSISTLGVRRVDRDDPSATTSFLRQTLVCKEMAADGQQKSAEAATGRIGRRQRVVLQNVSEKPLNEIGRHVGDIAAVADKGVERVPIRGGKQLKRPAGRRAKRRPPTELPDSSGSWGILGLFGLPEGRHCTS